jgi:hypothetical protein
MCTVTFYSKGNTYLVGMNRDELFTRGPAASPTIQQYESTMSMHPTDAEGGTWIGVNEAGVTFALLNWNSPRSTVKVRSRGEVILQILPTNLPQEAEKRMTRGLVLGMRPFRLIGFFPNAEIVREWRWDGVTTLETIHFDWQPHHWFSSGLSDEEAAKHRSRITDSVKTETDAGSAEWLRSLHRSHLPTRGPFSVCVHRDDAATLSYTEVSVRPNGVTMRYRDGSPCLRDSFDSELSFRRIQPSLNRPARIL